MVADWLWNWRWCHPVGPARNRTESSLLSVEEGLAKTQIINKSSKNAGKLCGLYSHITFKVANVSWGSSMVSHGPLVTHLNSLPWSTAWNAYVNLFMMFTLPLGLDSMTAWLLVKSNSRSPVVIRERETTHTKPKQTTKRKKMGK